ncbi:MAG: hypothetical protein NZM04_04620 [Methylacidiphilales bacterium]|nr:hypothetical protein [Candidatus Methylacidiphilales bacterium]MDW8350087.1 glycosyltransferase [Verrucomicrobiae bacterium]
MAFPRVLILTSSTGGGHNARAYALQSWIKQIHPDAEIMIYKVLEQTHPLYAFGVSLYNTIQRRAPILHQIYFHFLEIAALHRSPAALIGKKRFLSVLTDFQPDIIVSVHAHTNHAYFALSRKALRVPPLCVTYCGEFTGGYGFSRHWVNPDADAFIGATSETCSAALHHGMNPQKIFHGGFLLDPRLSRPPSKDRDTMLRSVQLDPDKCTIIVPASGSGAQQHLKILKALLRVSSPLQVVFFCGQDTALIRKISQSSTNELRLRAFPYTTELPDWLRAADVIITRPGSATTSESILAGCPIVHHAFGGLMPQESVTLRYCLAHKLSFYVKNISELSECIARLSCDQALLEATRKSHEEHSFWNVPALIQYLLELWQRRRVRS